ncbi:reverse transcriptase domain-containing protein [Tanacetum coccineum]
MSVRLTDRSFQYPLGIAENTLVEVGKFTFLVDFIILEIEEDSKVPFILGRPFLHTADAVIRVKQKQLNLGVGTGRMIFNIESTMKHSYSNDYRRNLRRRFRCSYLELKPLPDNLEYVFLEEPSFLPVIISSQLSKEKKNKLISVLKKHKQAFAWKTTDILVVTNENDELVPTRTVMGWRVKGLIKTKEAKTIKNRQETRKRQRVKSKSKEFSQKSQPDQPDSVKERNKEVKDPRSSQRAISDKCERFI